MIVEMLTSAVGSIFSGGVFGALGSAFTKWMNRREQAKQREHDLEMLRMQADETRWKTMQEITANAKNAAMNWSPAVKGASQWVVDIRSLHRPVLTYLLVGVATWLILWTNNPTLIEYGVRSAVFLASAAVGFWFAERGLSLPGEKH